MRTLVIEYQENGDSAYVMFATHREGDRYELDVPREDPPARSERKKLPSDGDTYVVDRSASGALQGLYFPHAADLDLETVVDMMRDERKPR